MHRFLIIVEQTENNYSAYSPDLPGCIATGATREEAEQNMEKAIEMHVRGLQEDKLPVPEPRAHGRAPRHLTQLTVFISGTTETDAEKSALRKVADELNKMIEKIHAVTLRVRSWPDDVRPGVNTDPQAELNRQIGSDYDIYIGLLGARFGTPTPRAGSGTEEEFKNALTKFKVDSRTVRLLFYFKRSIEDPFSIDVEELQKVKRFRQALTAHGVLYRDFQDTTEFVRLIKDHLLNLILEEWQGEMWKSVPLSQGTIDMPATEAREAPREGAANNQSKITRPNPAKGIMNSDDEELGFLEYIEAFHQAVGALLRTFESLSTHTMNINDKMSARTAESSALQQEFARLKNIGGHRKQQDYASKAKKTIDAAAADLDEYAVALASDLEGFRTHSRSMLVNFRAALESGTELGNPKRDEDFVSLVGLIETMGTTRHKVTEFQSTIGRLPALTGKLKLARNRTTSLLGELIAEISFLIDEAKSIHELMGKNENTSPAS